MRAAPHRIRYRLLAGGLLAIAVIGGLGALAREAGKSVQGDLAAAQRLMSQAAGKEGSLVDRTAKLDRARVEIDAAQQELRSFPLRQLAAVPLLGRDVRVAQTVAAEADTIAAAGQDLLTTLTKTAGAKQAPAPVVAVSTALSKLTETVRSSADSVRASRPLFQTRAGRDRFLAAAAAAEQDLLRLSQAAGFLSSLYGAKTPRAYFVGFQNPAESRGTGGLVGVFGVLASSASGPTLRESGPIESLQEFIEHPPSLPPSVRARYRPFGFDGDWRQANLPPDLPTVGPVMIDMYERVRGTRLQGVIMIDPLGSAEILRVSGPITVDGRRLDARNLPHALMVDAYVRYEGDPAGRKKFLTEAAGKVLQAMKAAAGRRPLDLLWALRTAVLQRHLQVYSTDPGTERLLRGLGMAGNGDAPARSDYLMPVGINIAGNKLDAFLRKELRYDVRLRADGGANTTATVKLENAGRKTGLPTTVIGPFDSRFQPGENRQFMELYVARDYGLSKASVNGRRIRVHALDNLGGLMLGSEVSIPAKQAATIEYRLERRNAVQVDGDRVTYRILVRPQPQVRPDRLTVSVTPPKGWKLAGLPAGFVVSEATAAWSGVLDRERVLDFRLEPIGGSR